MKQPYQDSSLLDFQKSYQTEEDCKKRFISSIDGKWDPQLFDSLITPRVNSPGVWFAPLTNNHYF